MSDPGQDPFTWRTALYGLVGVVIIFGVVLLVQKIAWEFPLIVLGLIAIPLIFSPNFRASFLDVLHRHLIWLVLTAAFVLAVASCSLL
jgi:hypothetical protein